MESNIEKKQPKNPRLEASILSQLFFWWLNPLMSIGAKKDLDVHELYEVLPVDKSDVLGPLLEKEWKKEAFKATETKEKTTKPSLLKALCRTFGLRYMLVGLFTLFEECVLRIGQPLCLGKLVYYFGSGDNTISTWEAYLYATGVVLGSALYTFSHHPYFFECQHVGMQIRIAACSLVYKKCLRLSQKAMGQTTIGQMVNLMSNDVSRFDFSVLFLHYLWVGPLQTLITMIVLLQIIGPSCLIGLAVLILFVPLQSWMGRVFSKLRLETAKRTDERIRTMNEIISAMRVIKMYTWEKPFSKLVERCRRKEVNVIRRTAYFRSFNMSVFFTSSKLIIFLTFLVYILTGNHLTAEKVFVTVALFNNIRLIMTLFFPSAITMLAEAIVSVKRIQDFLLLDEKSKCDVLERPALNECIVELNHLAAKWPSTGEKEDNTLTDISFVVRPGQTLAVIGHVGAGKGSLLNVILGELSPLSGTCRVSGKIAYAPQEAWIFSGTIRQNILCGLDYDLKRYKRVIKACALEKDFSLFPNGDQTAVGERGVSLSGGQKARVSLARALYVDADIYLLDDPLSAVDTHVGRHLFDRSIKGFLRDKIRILVTHQLQYLKDVDQILILKEGRIEAIGTYEELNNSGLDVAKTLQEDEEHGNDQDWGRSISESDLEGSFSRHESLSNSTRNRVGSSVSKTSLKEKTNKPTFVEEARSSGSVSLGVYWQYFRSGGGYLSFILFVLTCLFTQVLYSGSDYWLSIWTNAEEKHSYPTNKTHDSKGLHSNITVLSRLGNATQKTFEEGWFKEPDTITGVYVFTVLIAGVFIFSMIRTVHFFVLCMVSSVNLHNHMFSSVIRAPLLFFDKNPVGRILNRFAKDIGCMDELLPAAFFDVITIFLSSIGILVVVAAVNLWLLLPVLVLAAIFVKFRQFYLKTARNIKRLESTTRSPVFTHLSSSLVGLTTLRAHNSEEIFQRIFDEYQDIHSSAWYMFLATTRWFGIWLDWICATYVACVTYACVGLRDSISSSEAGLAISSAMALTGMFQWGVRQSAEVENQMTSVERVIEYSKLPKEADMESKPEKKPPTTWPSDGTIQFNEMSLRYNDIDQPVLKNITCLIQSKEKIGIVGRTGAGKSSLITSLFRLTEPNGQIIIDGIDTKTIGLYDLRSKISIIPQDPVLFSGTLRRNLDPFGEYCDDILWSALENVKLKQTVSDLPSGLDSLMTEGGANFSVGQRQLICLARAILRRNSILVMDEATANVDHKTDALIQFTIREKFKDCTVLTIAHRLNTIMDADKVMVLDAGCLMEFDEPAVLLQNPKSMFCSLVEQTGALAASELNRIAKEASEQRKNIATSSPSLGRNLDDYLERVRLCPMASLDNMDLLASDSEGVVSSSDDCVDENNLQTTKSNSSL